MPEELAQAWFGTPAEFSLVDRLPVVLVAVVILAWAAVLGWLALVGLRVARGLTRLETFVFSIAVGLNMISTYVLAVGLAGWLHGRAVFLAPAAATFALVGWLWHKRKQEAKNSPVALSPGPSPETGEESSWWTAAKIACLLPFAAVILLGAMLPPVEFDVREYHLQAPKEFYLSGQIGFVPHNVYANMPLGAEMQSLLGMVIAGDWWIGALAGKTVIACYALLTALALLAAGRRFVSARAGWVAAVVYLSIPWIVQEATLGLIDTALAFYLFLAWYALCLYTSPLSLRERVRVRGSV